MTFLNNSALKVKRIPYKLSLVESGPVRGAAGGTRITPGSIHCFPVGTNECGTKV